MKWDEVYTVKSKFVPDSEHADYEGALLEAQARVDFDGQDAWIRRAGWGTQHLRARDGELLWVLPDAVGQES